MKTKIISLFFILAASIGNLSAYDVQVNNLYYNLLSSYPSDNFARVTFKSYDSKMGYNTDWSISNASIPSSITCYETRYTVYSIGSNAFNGCSGLTSVEIPNSVTYIGEGAFRGCNSLTYMTIPYSVTNIEEMAFASCSSLIAIHVEDGNQNYRSINGVVFSKNLTTLIVYPCGKEGACTIPNSVTSIAGSAFYGCSGLTSIEIPNSVTSIGSNAFNGCSGLTSVEIPNSVTSIDHGAFSGCTGLTSVEIPNSITYIPTTTFYGCSNLTAINVAEENQNFCSVDGVLFSKDQTTLIMYPNGKEGAYTIPNSVTSIKSEAFYGCSGLTSITIPSSVTSIGYHAFHECTNLTAINVAEENQNFCSVDGVLFSKDQTTLIVYPCGKEGACTIPNSVTSIGTSAFDGCSVLTSVTIGNSVTSIGDYAFSGCSGLTSVTIGNSVTSIGRSAFYGCYGLTSVTIPNSVTSIGDGSFNGCSGLTSVTIGNSVTSIGWGAFSYCTGLTSIEIPNNVTSIESYAFDGCDGLTSVTLNSNAIAGKAYYHSNLSIIFGSQVAEYIIGDEVTSIGWGAFSYCTGLTSVTIGNSVTNIGNEAFNGCSGLTSVTIGNSVTSIGWGAFSYCTGLTSITCEAVTPPTCDSYAFDEVDKSIPLYVPEESITAYQAANEWKEFYNIQAITNQTDVNNTITDTYCITHKIIREGQLVIEREGKMYDVQGQEVK